MVYALLYAQLYAAVRSGIRMPMHIPERMTGYDSKWCIGLVWGWLGLNDAERVEMGWVKLGWVRLFLGWVGW